ncbi:hypothetical protein O3G_MSEX014620 [Manduca sexta]|uniref:Cytochrome P450 n=2 Tax=Manduca sexta TaxID=7130 RepID=A0A922CZV0_MANSE|nr:hypothetical protein O3G_MSEX014620 [Manduca sexta]
MEKGSLTDAEIVDELNTLIITGYDTVADTLCHTLMLLGSYPEVQERAYKEIQDVFGNDFDRDVDKLDLSKLVYLEAVIKESLRYIPTVPVVARYTETDITLKKYTIPANSTFYVLVCGLHSNSVWGVDADKFRPERWLNRATLPQNPNAFGVFGIGRRSCIGKNYAMMSMKTTITHILRRYKITSDISKLVLKMEALLKPASGQHISLERRK